MKKIANYTLLFQRCVLWLCMCVFLVNSSSSNLLAQDYDHDEDVPVEPYRRPEYKVYKSLSYALTQPDSVFILELKGKRLKTVPEDILRLPNLVVLDLSKNKLDSIPEFLTGMSNLVELDLSANKLESIPASIGNMTALEKLALNRNVITNLPSTIGEMQSLKVLELWDNELETLPDEIKDLRKLQVLELRGILFSEEEQLLFHELLPRTKIYLSPPCDCKTY